MTTYRVVKDGTEVLNVQTDEYEGLEPFGEHRQRPESGRVELWVDDEIVAVQEPLDEAAEQAALVAQLEAQLAAARGEEV
jgi:hypothetical protein